MSSKKKISDKFYQTEEQEINYEIPVNINLEDSKRLLQELQLKGIELELTLEKLKQSKAELEQKLNGYADFYENSDLGFLTIHEDGTILNNNASAARFFSSENLKNAVFLNYIVPESIEFFTNILLQKKSQNIVLQLVDNYKNIFSAHINITFRNSFFQLAIIPENGKVTDAIKNVENRLLQQERNEINFKFAERVTHMGSFQHNLITHDCNWSDELFRICGFKPQAFIPDSKKFIGVFHPDDRKTVELSIAEAIKNKAGYKHECRVQRPSGEIRYVISFGQCVAKNINNQPAEILGALLDVTEQKEIELSLKESEENYRTLFETMPVGLAISDPTGKIIYGNRKSRILLGISRSELKQSAIDLRRWKFVTKDGTDIALNNLPNMKVIRENKAVSNSEIGIIRENNQLTWLNVTAAPLQNRDHILIAFIDISAQIEREKQLKMLSENFKELNATKDKFFSIIAHDLKNPFNSILGFSDLLLKNISKYKYDDIERFVGIINSTSQNAYNLLENLLNWSRSQTGTIEFNPAVYDLGEIITSNIEFVENSALKKNIKINFQPQTQYWVEIDKNMIDTVLRNILTNSIKFTYPGGKITINLSSEDNVYQVSIKDNGIGIEEENIDKLFRIDSKYSSYGTNQEKGSGLGLIISKEFIERNNGTIWANSEFGKGSEFVFTLPKAVKKDNQ